MSNVENSTIYPYIGGQSNVTYSLKEGVDQVGNAGQIPSSGAISFNHFRGTDNNPTTTLRYVAGFYSKQSMGLAGTWSNHSIQIVIGGTWGTNYAAGSTWTTSTLSLIHI